MIDLERIESIKNIVLPHNKRSMESFFGKINFVRRFIFEFPEITRPLQDMIKKDVDYKWTKERKDAFMKFKEAIVEAPTLWSPNFENVFILYTFLLIIQSRLCSLRKIKLENNFLYHS